MVAVPYCKKCNLKVDARRTHCPKCGSPTRFKMIRRENADRMEGEREDKGGYIRPPSAS